MPLCLNCDESPHEHARTETRCLGCGTGHKPGHIRGYWPGFDADVAAERAWWASREDGAR